MSYGQRANADLFLYSGFLDPSTPVDFIKMPVALLRSDPHLELKQMLLAQLGLGTGGSGGGAQQPRESLLPVYENLRDPGNQQFFTFMHIYFIQDADRLNRALLDPPSLAVDPAAGPPSENTLRWLRLKCRVMLE